MRAALLSVLGFLLVIEASGRGRWVRRSRSDGPWRSNHQAAAPPLRKETADLLYGLTQPGTLKVRREDLDLDNHLSFSEEDHQDESQETGLTTTFLNKASDQEVARCKIFLIILI